MLGTTGPKPYGIALDRTGNVYTVNGGNATVTKIVVDATAPVVALLGSGTVNVLKHGAYVDPGAIWTDDVDGTGTVTAFSGTVDTAILGIYSLRYQKIDSAGNASATVTRTVNVVSGSAPVVTLVGSGHTVVAQGSGAYADPGATVSDVEDGDLTARIVASGAVDTTTVGTYVIDYAVTDSQDNTGRAIRTVVVADRTAPATPTIRDFSPNPAAIGDAVTLKLAGVESGATVSVPGMSCSPNPAGTGGEVTCTGVMGRGELVGTLVTVTVSDPYGNPNAGLTLTISVAHPAAPATFVGGGGGGWGGGAVSAAKPVAPETAIPEVQAAPSAASGSSRDRLSDGATIPGDQGEMLQDASNPLLTRCATGLDLQTIDQGAPVSDDFRIAHQMLYRYGLTSMRGTADFGPTRTMTREEAARFLVGFATNILCRTPVRTYSGQFSDLAQADERLAAYVQQAYAFGIFYGDREHAFRPKEAITSDELAAGIVRLLTGKNDDADGADWARHYRVFLATRISPMPQDTRRDHVALILYALYRRQAFEWSSNGYFIRQ